MSLFIALIMYFEEISPISNLLYAKSFRNFHQIQVRSLP